MPLLSAIREKLTDDRILRLDPDSEHRIRVHREILSTKPMMKSVFLDFYKLCLALTERYLCQSGTLIELGAGVSFFKEIEPRLLVTDVVPSEGIEALLDAQEMNDIADTSVRALYGINCFHHLNDPRAFFRELRRTLRPGGGCVLIEPYYSIVSRPFYRNLHRTEHFNMSQQRWEAPAEMGFMTNANQALSYIVFVRDREIFEREFPDLEIVVQRPLDNFLRYLCSGGLNFRQLLPNWTIPIIRATEFGLRPLGSLLALHHVIVLRKRS